MPKYYCEYCDIYLTHSSPGGRRQHNAGRKHVNNKIDYFLNLVRSVNFTPPPHILEMGLLANSQPNGPPNGNMMNCRPALMGPNNAGPAILRPPPMPAQMRPWGGGPAFMGRGGPHLMGMPLGGGRHPPNMMMGMGRGGPGMMLPPGPAGLVGGYRPRPF